VGCRSQKLCSMSATTERLPRHFVPRLVSAVIGAGCISTPRPRPSHAYELNSSELIGEWARRYGSMQSDENLNIQPPVFLGEISSCFHESLPHINPVPRQLSAFCFLSSFLLLHQLPRSLSTLTNAQSAKAHPLCITSDNLLHCSALALLPALLLLLSTGLLH
jgi:hypothetical protein